MVGHIPSFQRLVLRRAFEDKGSYLPLDIEDNIFKQLKVVELDEARKFHIKISPTWSRNLDVMESQKKFMAKRCFELENAFPKGHAHISMFHPQHIINRVFSERADTFFYFIPAEWGKDGERWGWTVWEAFDAGNHGTYSGMVVGALKKCPLRKCDGHGEWVWKKPKIPNFLPPGRINTGRMRFFYE